MGLSGMLMVVVAAVAVGLVVAQPEIQASCSRIAPASPPTTQPIQPQLDAQFGSYIQMSGTTMCVGAIGWEKRQGAVFVYKNVNGTWTLDQRVMASDGSSKDQFGWQCDVLGNRLVVGAIDARTPMNGTERGAVYVFERSTFSQPFTQTAKLVGRDNQEGDNFGYAVTLNAAGEIFVGAEQSATAETAQFTSGAVYIWQKQNNGTGPWAVKQLIRGDEPFDEFGDELKVGGDRLGIGSVFGEEPPFSRPDAGAVHVYRKFPDETNYRVEVILTQPTDMASRGDHFGTSMLMNNEGNLIVVGADQTVGASGARQGAAFLYRYRGNFWRLDQIIFANDGQDGDKFGQKLSLQSGLLVITGSGINNDKGAAYVFRLKDGDYVQTQKFSIAANGGRFGLGMEMLPTSLVVSAPFQSVVTPAAGEEPGNDGVAYLYRVTPHREFPSRSPLTIEFFPSPARLPNSPTTVRMFINYMLCVQPTAGRVVRVNVFSTSGGPALASASKTLSANVTAESVSSIPLQIGGLQVGSLYRVTLSLVAGSAGQPGVSTTALVRSLPPPPTPSPSPSPSPSASESEAEVKTPTTTPTVSGPTPTVTPTGSTTPTASGPTPTVTPTASTTPTVSGPTPTVTPTTSTTPTSPGPTPTVTPPPSPTPTVPGPTPTVTPTASSPPASPGPTPSTTETTPPGTPTPVATPELPL